MRYFFIGIGGVSMSALAKLLWHRGAMVYGSDAVASSNTRDLQALGIKVYIGHQKSNLQAQPIDCLVINGAIADGNPELTLAREMGIKIVYREQILAKIARQYHHLIAIAGCHGKSSTTAMIGKIFQMAGKMPTIHNGVKDNLVIGEKNFFITEACEFRRSFLKLKPHIAVVTNVDADHLDCYQDLADIQKCFQKFAAQSDILIKNADDKNSRDLFGHRQTITFGMASGDVHAFNLAQTDQNTFEFDVAINPAIFGVYYQTPRFKLQVPGRHNVLNALAAITCGLVCQLDWKSLQMALQQYGGIARRFQRYQTIGNTPVILDYAHHPHEIETTIQTANALYQNYLLVFQPHTYTRTIALWNEFVKVLGQIKHLVLYKTYAARGKVLIGGRALDLSRQLKTPYFADPQRLKAFLIAQAPKYDAIILCGAGDVVSGEFLVCG